MRQRAFSFSDEFENGRARSPIRTKSTDNKSTSASCDQLKISQNPFRLQDYKFPEPDCTLPPVDLAKPPEYAKEREIYVGSPNVRLIKLKSQSKGTGSLSFDCS